MGYVQTLNSLVLGLFASGEPGFWLDPSDLSTMYQDVAGTTAVTAVEQPVGLILDKSQGLVLGAELVTNGGPFTNTSGWANTTPANGTLSASGGLLTLTTTNIDFATFAITTVVGKWYKVAATIASAACPGFYAIRKADDTAVTTNIVTFINTSTGSGGGYFLATATTSYIVLQINGAGTASISLASCKSLAGTHYYQSTAGVRPVLSARVNGLTKTEDYADAYWIKQQVAAGTIAITPAQGIAPNGTNTASQIVFTAPTTSDLALLQGAFTTVNAQPYKSGIYLKAFSAGDVGKQLLMRGASGGGYTLITLTNSWVFAATTEISASSGVQYFVLGLRPVLGGSSGTVSVLAWGADARPSDQATGLIPTYQRVNTSTDYDTAGFPLYLSGNGTQWMQCAAQDYTGVNKIMLCGGIRKKSDAALAVVFELSPTIASNNGAVLLSAPNSAAANLNFSSKGTTQVDNVVTTYTSPNTTVLTGLGDISAPSNIVRVNGAQVGSVSTTQGTGNYGNYAGFLFARNGASSMLTGNLYQLIARGSTVASNAAQISATENWTNLKTKAY